MTKLSSEDDGNFIYLSKTEKLCSSKTSKFPKLINIEKKIELPMLFLSFVWLFVLITELVHGANSGLSEFGTILWALFILYFILRLVIAPSKMVLLKKNWLFILAILVSVLRLFPSLEPFPLVRGLTVTFGMQVIWIFASADQGIRFVRRALGKRAAGYVLALTSVIILAGAAGILHFESMSEDTARIQNYPNAIWWAAMQMTNIGSSYSMKTIGGRIICLAISIYAAGVFGYLTALFATLIIDREIKDPKVDISNQKQMREIQNEIARLSGLVEGLVKNTKKNGL